METEKEKKMKKFDLKKEFDLFEAEKQKMYEEKSNNKQWFARALQLDIAAEHLIDVIGHGVNKTEDVDLIIYRIKLAVHFARQKISG